MNSAAKTDRLFLTLVILVYVAIQSVGLMAPRFPADDAQELAFVRSFGHWWQSFGVDAFGLFRPMKNLLFLIFAQMEAWGMPTVRMIAVMIGIATVFPVRAFFRRIFPTASSALFATAIWFLAPTLVSSVAWLSCVNIQLMCGFAAAAFVLHDRARIIPAAISLFLACVSYEQAVAIGPCLVVFDFFLRPERFRTRRGWASYFFYALVTLVFLVLRQMMGATHSVNGSFAHCTRMDIIFAAPYLSGQHFLSWFFPFGRFSVFGGYVAGNVPIMLLLSAWMLVVLMAFLSLCLRRSFPVFAFGIAFSMVAFLPVSNMTGVGNGPYGDYYLGLPSFGLATILLAVCTTRIGLAIVTLSRIGAVVAAFHWSWLWADGDRAFFASAANFPDFFGNRIFLVTRLANIGMWKEALQLGEEVESIVGSDSGQMSAVHLVRGLYELRNGGDATRAMREFEMSRKVNDFNGALCNCDYYKGCVCEDLLCDSARAEKLYASALSGKWTVDSVPPADRLARLLALRGQYAEAISLWERALRMCPDNRNVAHNLAIVRKRMLSEKDCR